MIVTARKLIGGIWASSAMSFAPGWSRQRSGSGLRSGHQNRQAAARYSRCSTAWTPSSSRARVVEGVKWDPHMTPANASQPTTGNVSAVHEPAVKERQEVPLAHVRRRRPQGERADAARGEQRRRDGDEEQVLDHVDAQEVV